MDMPTEDKVADVSVELSTGVTVVVGMMDWGGYKKFKPKMLERLAGRVGSTFSDLEGKSEAEIMAPMMVALDEVLIELTEEFVGACVAEKKALNGKLRPVDWLRLRQAAAEVNDLAEILELEKNALTASIKTLMGMMSDTMPVTNEAADGGSS